MNKCKKCGKETKNPKFCSSSCAASINNIGRARNKKPRGNCTNCGNKLTGSGAKYCSIICQQEYQYKDKINKWLNGIINFPGRSSIKKYLKSIKLGCWECGITTWNDKDIVLELEHIDGNSDNNLKDNLSLLCPNCHSQTDTYKAKNVGNGRHFRRERYKTGKSY